MGLVMTEALEAQADHRCKGCRPDHWGRPPTFDAYTELTDSLFAVEVGVENEALDELDGAFHALQSVVQYLNSDLVCRQLGLTKMLARTVHALNDTSRGAKPPLFFGRPKRTSGAPNYLAESVLRAQVILMFRLLLKGGVEECEASKRLSAELKKGGIIQKKTITSPDGQPIAPHQIARWNAELGGKSLSGCDGAYAILEKNEVARRGWPKDPEQARKRVARLIQGLLMGF
jgi:hypothetical protein